MTQTGPGLEWGRKGAHGEKFKEIFILKFNPHLLNTESEYLLKFSSLTLAWTLDLPACVLVIDLPRYFFAFLPSSMIKIDSITHPSPTLSSYTPCFTTSCYQYLVTQDRIRETFLDVSFSSPPSRQSPSPNHSTLYNQPFTSIDAKPIGTEDQLYSLYYSILYKGLGHLQILVSKGLLEPVPHRYQEITVHISIIHPLHQAYHPCVTRLNYYHLSTGNLQQPHTWSSRFWSCFPPITFSYHNQNGLS